MKFVPCLLAICLVCSAHGADTQAPRPNVVILLTDDQGTLDVNCYGSKDLLTPNMDKLAASGVRFTQAYAHTVCCPARAALFTGRHPQRSGIRKWTQGDRHGSDRQNVQMGGGEFTIAEAMKAAGYRTALFGKWHLGAERGHGPLDQGFDTYFGHLGGFIDNYRHYFLHGRGYHDLYDGNEEVFLPEQYYPDLMVDRAIRFIQENKAAPFFMTVAFNLPHYPEQPGDQFKSTYADMPMPRQSYARVISTVDEHIGRILTELEQTGLRERTIVILMSDNGHSVEDNAGISLANHASGYPRGHYYLAHGGGGNTGKWIGHKATFLEGGIRVPAIISYPGKLPQGETRDQIMTIMDWCPTLLDLCGIPWKSDAPQPDGHSLLPILVDARAPDAYGGVLHFEWHGDWAVRDGEWKLISSASKSRESPKRTLHRLTDDNPEAKDYAAEHPEIVGRLQSMHEKWFADVSPTKMSD